MKAIVFDSGPVISLTVNNLLGLLTSLKERYNGCFSITDSVRKELIERPLETKKFKFEALQVLRCIKFDVLTVHESPRDLTIKLLDLANKAYIAKGNCVQVVHYAEMSSLAAAILNEADAFVVDERNTRLLLEEPERLAEILSRRLHTEIKVNKKNLDELRRLAKGIRLIRSVELITVSFEMGLLDKYVVDIPNARKTLLEAVLWGVKLNGCSVSEEEIDEILKIEINSRN
ncbi:MAG TPA: hypothetical protein VFF28_01135 [Candidatus Nanoarchaeia archaeon]|nr:hypothetical protein [Candidatus Nanoarchaeia archaeon]